jgi:hypothetical protein
MRLLPEIIDSASAIQEIRRNIHAHPALRSIAALEKLGLLAGLMAT